MNRLLKDLIFGLRLLRRERTYAVTALLTLAICLAANVAVFSIVHSVVLSPLPFPESDRILLMHNSYPGAGFERSTSAVPDYYDRLTHLGDLFEEQALYDRSSLTIGEKGAPRRVQSLDVTPSFFRLLQVSPRAGRFFTEAEGEPGMERKVVLGFALWQQLYGGSPSILGQTLRLDGNEHEIVGVTSPDFVFIDPGLQLFRPLAFTAEERADDRRHSNNYENIGRLRPEASIEQIRAKLAALTEINHERFPQLKPLLINSGYSVKVKTLKEDVIGDVRENLYLLWGGVLCVLLIGAVNVANLSLARSNSRSKEMATRLAMGATLRSIARQLVTESLLLGLAGGIGGLLLGIGLLNAISGAGLTALPRGSEIGVDLVVIAASLGAVLLLSLFLGLLPISQALRVNLSSVFREDSRTGTSGAGTVLLRNALVVAQVGLAFLLLIGSGLLFASFQAMLAINPGFEMEQPITTARVTLPEIRYSTVSDLRSFFQRALQEISVLPGVAGAGTTSSVPFGQNFGDSVILAEGYQMQPGESLISPSQIVVSNGYFQSMGIPLLEGRSFDDSDTADSLPSIIVDRKLAQKFWPGESPLGRRMYFPGNNEDPLAITEGTRFFHVVGVVGEVKHRSLIEADGAVGAYYFSLNQAPRRAMTFTLRSAGKTAIPIDNLRRVVQGIDPELPVFDVFTMEQLVDNSLSDRRTPMMLSLGFAAVSLLLAAVGIYGVLAYLVAQRTREIGIRIALGSAPLGVFGLVFRRGAMVLALGFLAGGAGYAVVSRYLSGLIYGVSGFDPKVIAAVAGLLGVVALLACLLPARRATRIDPVRALNL